MKGLERQARLLSLKKNRRGRGANRKNQAPSQTGGLWVSCEESGLLPSQVVNSFLPLSFQEHGSGI